MLAAFRGPIPRFLLLLVLAAVLSIIPVYAWIIFIRWAAAGACS